ncbi:MAG TPA: endolytic transglycosylase MltG, partial [Saprospiraceae bacterium]|nr:endolytic transglycosylase MltG [Saprospiraceae bacterium]
MSLIQMVRHLRSGEQAPVNVVLTNERLPENVAAKIARFIEPDSAQIYVLFSDPEYLQSIGYTPETFMSLFIPNTYQVYWNSTPEQFTERMVKEHKAFWDKENRLEKARRLDMTPEEVYTLASIVDRETLQRSEKPTIAGAYLNRLKINMPLQADPTCVFATRDFETKRVTEYHTKFDSPYNTYMYAGLPPGPIGMASISG